MKKGPKKVDTMRFSTDHRADLLTEALKFRNFFAERNTTSKVLMPFCLTDCELSPDTLFYLQRFNAYKYHWSDNRVPVILEVNQGSLDQLDGTDRRLLCSYDYKDLEGLTQVD